MSIIHIDAMPAAAAELAVVTLSGGTAIHGTGFLTATAGWQTRADGTMWKYQGGAFVQNASGSDWIFPRTTFDPVDYEVRMNNTLGSGPDTGDAVNTWLAMNSTRFWYWSCNRFCVEASDQVFDIRHATDGSKNTVLSIFDGAACMATSSAYSVFIEAT